MPSVRQVLSPSSLVARSRYDEIADLTLDCLMAKTALITGANRGIGQQVARVLATDGWDVLVGSRDKAKGEAAAARLRKDTGGRLKAVELDVTSDASIAAAAQKLRDGAIK